MFWNPEIASPGLFWLEYHGRALTGQSSCNKTTRNIQADSLDKVGHSFNRVGGGPTQPFYNVLTQCNTRPWIIMTSKPRV